MTTAAWRARPAGAALGIGSSILSTIGVSASGRQLLRADRRLDPGSILAEGADGSTEWAAYVDDFAGDDLRRRWDDPSWQKMGEHPVIFAGALSYGHPAPGDGRSWQPFLSPLVRLTDRLNAIGRRLTPRGAGRTTTPTPPSIYLRIPFVDYARGDGRSIGPGGSRPRAEPVLRCRRTLALEYRGLWGCMRATRLRAKTRPPGL